MKKHFSILLIIIFISICLTACDDSSSESLTIVAPSNNIITSEEKNSIYETTPVQTSITEKNSENNKSNYVIDFEDATSFETALNNGESVKDKIVQFEVNDYKPDSKLGINCWAGEHLNFILKDKTAVKKGDIIIGRCTKDASKVMIYSWKIPFEIIEIKQQNIEQQTTTIPPTTKLDKNQIEVPYSAYSFKNDDVTEVVALLKEVGFTNIKTKPIYDLDHNSSWDSSKLNWIESISIDKNTNFSENDMFDKNALINISYHVYERDNPVIIYNQYTASELFEDLERNPMRAENTHLNEYVEVDGEVFEISPRGDYIVICAYGDPYGIEYIYCDAEDDSFYDYIYNLSVGDAVIIRGKIITVNLVHDYKIAVHKFVE